MKASKEPRIDLIAYRRKEQLERRGILWHLVAAGLIVVLFLGAMGSAWWLQNKQIETLQTMNQQQQQKVDRLAQTVASTVAKTDTLLNKQKSQDSRQALLNNLEAAAQMKSKLLREIYQLSIPDITFGKLEMKANNELAISAYCNSQTRFIKFLGQLRELDFIKEVKNISSQYNDKTGEVSFNLTLVWEVDQ